MHFVLMGLAALGVTLGWRTRACAAAYFVLFTYVELLDKTTYLNHYYLVSLLSFLMIWLPLGRRWSVDVVSGRLERRVWCPAWAVWWIRGQLALVYFFAGVAKLQPDWLR